MPRIMHTGTLALCGALALLIAGCAGDTPAAYVQLQDSIKQSIVKDDQRPVQSVGCTPRVQDVSYGDGFAHLRCVVSFTNGSSYTTAATIEARAYQVAGYNFEFDEPGPIDITTAPLPQPRVSLGAASAGSLFHAGNLAPVINELSLRFPSKQLVLSMALYPGELEAVIGADGEARLVTAHPSGALTVGPQTQFDGERTGIEISQLDPGVPGRLANTIAAHGGVPVSHLGRFVLGFAGEDAIWRIYPTTGAVRFQAHILGDALERVEGSRTTSLSER
jgi:hypothetical protein